MSAEVKILSVGVEVIPMKTFLQNTEKNSPSIITRKSTRDLWDIVVEITTTPNNHVLVTGSSGVGKSRSMAYLLRKLLLNGKTVVYESAMEEKFFLFKATGIVYEVMWVSSAFMRPSLIEELQDPGNFYLIDPKDDSSDPVIVPAHTILASSPNPKRYKGFIKRKEAFTRYMPMWNIEELEAVRHILGSAVNEDEAVTEDDLLERFHNLGGRPRSVFARDEVRRKEISRITDNVSKMTIELIVKVIEGTAGDLDESSDRKLGTPTSNICGYNSTNPFNSDTREVVFVSKLVEVELAKAHARKMWEKYDSLPTSFATFKGIVFQVIALSMIAKGSISFKCTRWVYLGGDGKTKENWRKSEESTRTFPAKELKTELSLEGNLKVVGRLCQSFNTNEAFIDGSSDEGTFQMTIGKDHPNSRLGAMKVTDEWGATAENKMPLYNAVPDDRYLYWSNKMKPPSFTGPVPEGWDGDEAMYAKIDFFVLEISMSPGTMTQFSGMTIN
jgi:hypothetical protein